MEDKMKRLLINKLEQSLLDHIVIAGTKEGGPSLLDAYQLQGLAELEYHLAVEHDFQAGEVAALLQFTDPLTVAMECWEERDPEKGFPICALLHEIKAYERFPLVDPAGYTQQRKEQLRVLENRLNQNMSDFQTELLSMEKAELIAQSAKITAMKEAHAYMKKYFLFEPNEVDVLLKLDNPLKFVADQWPSDLGEEMDMDFQIKEAIADAGKEIAAQQEKEQSAAAVDKPSVRRQLHDKIQEVGQRPPVVDRAKGGEPR